MKVDQRKIGVLLTYVSEIVAIATGLIYTPVMLRLLGQSEYGLYQLVYSVVSYLSLLSFGFSSAYIRFYSRYKVAQDDRGIARLNGMFLTIFAGISVICLMCGLIMVGNTRGILGKQLTDSELQTAKILLILMVFNLMMTFLSSVFDCYVSAHEQFVFQKTIIVLQRLFNPFMALPLLIMGYGSIAMIGVTTFLTILKFLVNGYYCKKKLKMQFVFSGFKWELFKEMWSFTFYIFLGMIVNQINWSADKFLLGRLLGTSAVAVYGVASQINTLYVQLSSAISSVFIPQINRLVAEGNQMDKINHLLVKTGRFQYMLLSLVLTGFILFGQEFIVLWAGEGYEEAYQITLLLIIPATIPLIQNIGVEVQRAMNREKVRSYVYLGIACLNVLISIPFIKIWGASGAAFGTAMSLIVGNGLFMNMYYYKAIKLDILKFWKEITNFSKGLIIPICFGVVMKQIFNTSHIGIYMLAIVLYTVVYLCSIWYISMNEYEKAQFSRSFNVIKKMTMG